MEHPKTLAKFIEYVFVWVLCVSWGLRSDAWHICGLCAVPWLEYISLIRNPVCLMFCFEVFEASPSLLVQRVRSISSAHSIRLLFCYSLVWVAASSPPVTNSNWRMIFTTAVLLVIPLQRTNAFRISNAQKPHHRSQWQILLVLYLRKFPVAYSSVARHRTSSNGANVLRKSTLSLSLCFEEHLIFTFT